MFNTDRHITMDSFGQYCPANWEELSAYLNEKIDAIIESYGEDAEYSSECTDAIANLWEDFCNGSLPDCPPVADVDINGVSRECF